MRNALSQKIKEKMIEARKTPLPVDSSLNTENNVNRRMKNKSINEKS